VRTLSSAMLASVNKTITDPVYLFKMDLGSQFIYATSREAITYDSNSYSTTGARLESIDNQRVRFSLPNFDRDISALAFAGQIQRNECSVYLHYDGEVIGRFSGLLDAPECSGDYNSVVFTAVDLYALVSRWPFERMQAPAFNHMPAVGTVVRLGSSSLNLKRDK